MTFYTNAQTATYTLENGQTNVLKLALAYYPSLKIIAALKDVPCPSEYVIALGDTICAQVVSILVFSLMSAPEILIIRAGQQIINESRDISKCPPF